MSPLSCALRLGTELWSPPATKMCMVRTQDRTVVLAIPMPAGVTLTKLVVTGKATAGAADSAEAFQKVLTTTSDLTAVGRITDSGASGTALATLVFAQTDSTNWPDRLHCQAWGTLSDGRQAPCESWMLHSIAPIPFVFSGSTASNLPPAGQATLAWAFDVAFGGATQSPPSRVGPTGQLGSATGADTNDPTYQVGPPARYAFATGQYVDFGSVLESVWTNAAGFTVMAGVDYEVADTGARTIVSKARGSGAEFALHVKDGKPYAEIYDGNGSAGIAELFTADAAIATGRRVVTFTYDPTQPRGSRVRAFVAGANVAGSSSLLGNGSAVGATATDLTIGARIDLGVQAPTAIGNVYAWPGVLTDQNILDNANWLKNTAGWQ